MYIQLLRGLIILSTISSLGGVLAWGMTFPFWQGFALTSVLQIVLFNIVRYIRSGYLASRARELELEEIKSFEKQGMELSCAHCRAKVFVPIRFDQQNSFQCPECEEHNAIYVNVTVARETTPLNVEAITSKLIIDEEEKLKDEMRIVSQTGDE